MKSDKTEELLAMIEEKNTDILAEEDLTPKFNHLLKHQLIDVQNGKVVLTERGKKARLEGFHPSANSYKLQENTSDFSKKKLERSRIFFWISLFITLLILAAVFIFIF